jgi:CRISPR-associated protein Cas1
MEPFRPFVDDKVFQKSDYNFDEYMKLELVDILNQEISYGSKTFILKNALSQYIRDCISYLDSNQEVEIKKVGFKDEE